MKAALSALSGWLLVTAIAPAAEPASKAPEPLRYYRLLVPEKLLDAKPEIAKGYSPYRREEFWKLLEDAQRAGGRALDEAGPRIVQATYRARWSREQGLKGEEARLEIAADGQSPRLLSLEPFGLAMGKALWDEKPPRPAVVGLTPQGKTAVLLDKSSVLTFPWWLRGKQGEAEHSFELALPAAAMQRLVLEAPSAWRPIVPGGIVSRQSTDAEAGTVTWQIDLGQVTPSLLTLVNSQDPAGQPLVLLREANVATLTPAGLDLNTSLTLDVHHQPLSSLVIHVPADVDVSAVRVGDKSLPFKLAAGEGNTQRMVVELSEPLLGVLRVINIQALTPWTPGKLRSLPRFSLEGAIWQEGSATLTVAPSLEMARIAMQGGRQTGVTPAAAASGESYQLQFFSPQASIDFLAREISPALHAESIGNIQLDPAQVSGVVTTRFTAERGETFDLHLEVSREWLVDSLDTTPPDVIEDRNFSQATDGTQDLHLRLKQAIREGQDLRLLVRARRRGAAAGEEIGPEQFRFLKFVGSVSERRTLIVGASDSAYAVRASGDLGLRRIALAQLPSSELSAIEHPEEHLAFVDDDSADSLRLKMLTEEPHYSAAIKVGVVIDGDQATETFHVRVQPQGTALNEVLVRFGLPTHRPLTWQIEDSEDVITAQPVREAAETGTDPGEMWRLRWKRARSESFELTARTRSSFAGTYVANWLSAPAAAAQTGTLEIGAENGSLLNIDAPDLDPVIPQAPREGHISRARAAYSYDPSRRVQVTAARRESSAVQPSLLVQSLVVDSTFQLDGRARHDMVARLDSLGVDALQVTLPEVDGPIEWMINGRHMVATPIAGARGSWQIALPEGIASVGLRCIYSTPQQPLGWLGRRGWEVELPKFDATVLTSVSRAHLPPGIRVAANNAFPASFAEVTQRLLGPLWRKGGYSFYVDQASEEWSLYETETRDHSIVLPVCYLPAGNTWGWSILFISLAFWLVVRRGSLRWPALAAGALVALVLFLPEAWLPFGSGALLGTLAAMVARACLPSFAPAPSRVPTPMVISASTLAGCLAIACYFGNPAARAQSPDASAKGTESPARRIIVPTDAEGEPTAYVYVEPKFHEQLEQLATSSAQSTVPWLIRSADYRLMFQTAEPGGKRRLEGLTLSIQVESLVAEGVIRLPLARSKVHLFPDGVSVDRTPVGADWSDDETELRIPLRGSGSHLVEVRFQPVLQVESGVERLDLKIPPVATSSVTVSDNAPADLELLKSSGTLLAPATGEHLVARLGPITNLQLRWSESAEDASAIVTEGNQLLWWKIRPGGVTAEARYRLRPMGGKLRELKIKLDSRMRVVAWDCDHEVTSQRQSRDEEFWRLTLKRPADKEVNVRAQFLLTGTTGIGNLVLPQADLVTDRVAQSWVGFTTANGLSLDLDSALQQNRIPAADFLTDWGVADGAPHEACRIAQEGGSRSVVIRPEAGKTRYQSRYLGSLRAGWMALRWEGHLVETSDDLFEIPITAPNTGRITSLNLIRGGMKTPIRYTVEKPGQLVAHLAQPLQSGAVIALEANLPWPNEPTALPEVSLGSALEDASQWRLYRHSSALVEVNVPKGWLTEEGQVLGTLDATHGRLLGAWRRTEGMNAITCRTSINEPQAVGRLITSVQRGVAGWQAEIQGDLEISGGQIDQLRLDVPVEWSGPFEATPAQQVEVSDSPQPGRKIVSLTPPLSLSGAWKFSLRSPLAASMGEGVRAPDAQLLDVGEIERLVILPIRWERQRVEWQTSGLQATEMPPDWPLAMGSTNAWEAFRAIALRYRATVKQVERFSGEPVVHLAEHRVRLTPNGDLTGESSFDIEPGGTGQLALELPKDLELVQVLVGPHPARIRENASHAWIVELNSDQWPQELRVVYRSRDGASQLLERLEVPRLAGLRVENTLWSLETDSAARLRSASLPGVSSQARQVLIRLDTLLASADVITEIGLAGETAENLIEGWANWRGRWQANRQAADALPEKERDAFFQAKLKSLDREFELLLPRLPAGALALDKSPPPADSSEDIVDRSAPKQVSYLAFTGEMSTLLLPARAESTGQSTPWFAVSFLAATLFAAVFLFKSAVVKTWLLRWPQLWLAALGVIWLLVLQPTWLGALLLAWAWWLAWNRWPGSQPLPFDARQIISSGASAPRTAN